MFNGARLSFVRKRRGLTAKALAELASIAPLTVTRLEKGENDPEANTVARFAEVLGYPIEFFYGEDLELLNVQTVSFRSLSRMTARERDAAISAGSLGVSLYDWIEEKFNLPAVNIPDFGRENTPLAAASELRAEWRLGLNPVQSMVKLLEANGVRVLSLSEETQSVDAYSFWKGSRPYIFLNGMKSPERSTFDAAHELGHLILHRRSSTASSRDQEREADEFASNFLMPEEDLRKYRSGGFSVEKILKLKKRWRVSAMMLCFRLHKLKYITDRRYKSLCIELNVRGYRKSEPDTVGLDKSFILPKVFESLWRDGFSRDTIASELCIPIDELDSLVGRIMGSEFIKGPDKSTGLKLVV